CTCLEFGRVLFRPPPPAAGWTGPPASAGPGRTAIPTTSACWRAPTRPCTKPSAGVATGWCSPSRACPSRRARARCATDLPAPARRHTLVAAVLPFRRGRLVAAPRPRPFPDPGQGHRTHAADAPVLRRQGGASGRVAVLPDGRLLRTLLRRRAQGRAAAGHYPHPARQLRWAADPDGGRAAPFRRRLPGAPGGAGR